MTGPFEVIYSTVSESWRVYWETIDYEVTDQETAEIIRDDLNDIFMRGYDEGYKDGAEK